MFAGPHSELVWVHILSFLGDVDVLRISTTAPRLAKCIALWSCRAGGHVVLSVATGSAGIWQHVSLAKLGACIRRVSCLRILNCHLLGSAEKFHHFMLATQKATAAAAVIKHHRLAADSHLAVVTFQFDRNQLRDFPTRVPDEGGEGFRVTIEAALKLGSEEPTFPMSTLALDMDKIRIRGKCYIIFDLRLGTEGVKYDWSGWSVVSPETELHAYAF